MSSIVEIHRHEDKDIKVEIHNTGEVKIYIKGQLIKFEDSKECTEYAEAFRTMWRVVRKDNG